MVGDISGFCNGGLGTDGTWAGLVIVGLSTVLGLDIAGAMVGLATDGVATPPVGEVAGLSFSTGACAGFDDTGLSAS